MSGRTRESVKPSLKRITITLSAPLLTGQQRPCGSARLCGDRISRQHARDFPLARIRIERHNCRQCLRIDDLFLDPPVMRTKRGHLRRMGNNKNLTPGRKRRQAPTDRLFRGLRTCPRLAVETSVSVSWKVFQPSSRSTPACSNTSFITVSGSSTSRS